jgi:AraC-like DNA-binding protein
MLVKATLLKRGTSPEQSFSVGKHDFQHFLKVWHYHSALELVYIIQSEGTQFIGDNIDRFKAGDLMLLGSNLPHMYQNDEAYFEEASSLRAEAIAIHFDLHFLKNNIEEVPEFSIIQTMINRSKFGLKFSLETKDKIGPMIQSLLNLKGFEKMLLFLKILNLMSKAVDVKTIASPGFINHFKAAEDTRLDKIYDYVLHNFQEDLAIDQVADLVSMNKSSFCRYFKRTTQKTFTDFLNEVRIGYACKMLMERKMGVLVISYHCGYNNVSHFNRQFRKKTNMSPTEYVLQRNNA